MLDTADISKDSNMTAARTMAMAAVMLTTLGAAPAGAFDQTLVLHGVSFRVTCANDTPRPTLTITPSGSRSTTRRCGELDGHVSAPNRRPEYRRLTRSTCSSARPEPHAPVGRGLCDQPTGNR
jgi:hypothetical protein